MTGHMDQLTTPDSPSIAQECTSPGASRARPPWRAHGPAALQVLGCEINTSIPPEGRGICPPRAPEKRHPCARSHRSAFGGRLTTLTSSMPKPDREAGLNSRSASSRRTRASAHSTVRLREGNFTSRSETRSAKLRRVWHVARGRASGLRRLKLAYLVCLKRTPGPGAGPNLLEQRRPGAHASQRIKHN